MADGEATGAVRTIGVFIMTEGERAPDGGYRQCLVQATASGKIMLAAIDDPTWVAIIRTVTLPQLACIMSGFYATTEADAATGTGD